MKKKRLLPILYLGSFLCSVAPLTTYFIVNHHKYIGTYEDVIKLSVGGAVCLILLLLKICGRLKLPSSTVVFAFAFGLSYLLKSITDDILIFSFLILVGDIFDKLAFGIPIKRIREGIFIEKSADATSERVEELLKRYYRGGV